MSAIEDHGINELLATQLRNCETQWSLGTFGAIAEFARDDDELATLENNDTGLTAITPRGGIRLTQLDGVRLFASETATSTGWNQRVSLCLPDDGCAMGRRRVLTELGPDTDALREADRTAILFDLGLDALQVDACIRVADPQVAAALREHVGRGVFEPGNPAMSIIVPANPHRVFVSRLGRIEVYAPIPPAHGKSPEGPHTHVLPKLLSHRRTHPATEPVPAGWIPCAHMYPAHPLKDGLGRPLPFVRSRYDAFQRMLDRFGDPDAVNLKQQVAAAVTGGGDPSVVVAPGGRFGRATIRIALRQLHAADAALPQLAAWLDAHDRILPAEPDDSEAHHNV
jgi:hypothetical protein